LDSAITRIAHSDDTPVTAPEPTYGPAQMSGSEVERRMARFARL